MNADQIAQRDESAPGPTSGPKYKRGENPNSRKNLMAPWTSATAPRDGRKRDHAQEIAKRIFEQNEEAIYQALGEQLVDKGNAYAFNVLADRAYGKIKEKMEVTMTDAQVMGESDLNERIAQLERELGLARQIDEAGRVGVAQARTAEAAVSKQDQ